MESTPEVSCKFLICRYAIWTGTPLITVARLINAIQHFALCTLSRAISGEPELSDDKNGWFKKGNCETDGGECRDVGRATGPDRFVSGNNYWQSHAVLETQESIVARSDDSRSPRTPPPYCRHFTSSFFLGRRFAIFRSSIFSYRL